MRVLGVLAAAWIATTMPAWGSDDPQTWLQRMSHALEHLNYEGTLVQLQGADAEVMHIVHRVDNGVATERITALDEVGREIIRRGEEVMSILPDEQAVIVDSREQVGQDVSPLRQQLSGSAQFDERYYRLGMSSGGKLVSRDTKIVTIQAADRYRYGYRLWLDAATAMPLKVQIIGDDGVVVEQLLFSAISLPAYIPPSAVSPSATIDRYAWRRSPSEAVPRPVGVTMPTAWQAASLPPGFSLRAVRSERQEAAAAALEHLVYSDGVASVSVFIEPGVGAAEKGEGSSQLGGANAYTVVLGDYLVTAVGEVPVRTVEAIARSIRPGALAR